MKIIIDAIKNNWKIMIVSILYVISIIVIIYTSSAINKFLTMESFSLSLNLLLFISLFSIFSVVTKHILKFVFKDNLSETLNKSNYFSSAIGIAIIIGVTIALLSLLFKIPFDGELESIISVVFLIPSVIIITVISSSTLTIIFFISFLLLKFSINHSKKIVIIFSISFILWGFALTKNNVVDVLNTKNSTVNVIEYDKYLYDFKNNFFVHNNKAYFYLLRPAKSEVDSSTFEFFVSDYDLTNKEIIYELNDGGEIGFIHIDNNEAYFYELYTNLIKKINLETKEVSVAHEIFTNNEAYRYRNEYLKAKEEFYRLNPQFVRNFKYEIIDENFNILSQDIRNIILKNSETNEEEEYNNVLNWYMNDSSLFILHGEKIKDNINYKNNLKKIWTEEIKLY